VTLWDVHSGKVVTRLSTGEASVSPCLFSPDGTLLAVPGQKKLTIWNIAAAKAVCTCTDFGFAAIQAFGPDSRYFAVSDGFTKCGLWDTTTGKVMRRLDGGFLGFSPDNTSLAFVEKNHTILIQDVATGTVNASLRGHTALATKLAFSPDGKFAASFGMDKDVRVWEIASGKTLQVFSIAGEFPMVHFSPDFQHLTGVAPSAQRE
jgi:WD40 repeat protein